MNFSKKEQIISFLLLGLLVLTTLNSAYFFLSILKLGIFKWLAFNACSVASILFIACSLLYWTTKKGFWLAISLLPMYYYGTMGLFIMPWNQANIFAHTSHLIITLNITWIMYVMLKNRQFEELGKGLLLGMLITVPVIAIIQSYTQAHMDEFIHILQGM